MVLLFSSEITAPIQRAARALLLLLFFFPPLLLFFLCLYSSSVSWPLLRGAAESLLSLQASAAPVKVFEWMLGFHRAQLFLNALGCRETREEALPPSPPPTPPPPPPSPCDPRSSLSVKSSEEKASRDFSVPLPASVMKSLSVPPFPFRLMKFWSDSSHQANTWVMKWLSS